MKEDSFRNKEGTLFQAVDAGVDGGCRGCVFIENRNGCYKVPYGCFYTMRSDRRNVIWMEVKSGSSTNDLC